MCIVQIFWTASCNPLEHSFGWIRPEYNLMSWALSCLCLRKNYDEIALYTDEQGMESDTVLSLREVNAIHTGNGSDFPAESSNISSGEHIKYFGDERIDEDLRFIVEKYVVYTDYQPRLEGSTRYKGTNRPETVIAIYPYPDGSKRTIYFDHRYNLDGFSFPAKYYSSDYLKHILPMQADHRHTLYWNPDLKLDENSEANIIFYNNSRQRTLSNKAEDQDPDETLIW